jgi:hypothetical protein
MKADLTDLLGKREIFWELQEVAKANPAILTPGSFFDWMCRNYIAAASVGLRSFLDRSRDSHSLWRMLYEALENPGVINREFHVRMYRTTPSGLEMGNLTFDAVAGKRTRTLSQRAIRRDLRSLEDAGERIQRFVNKRIAHRTSPGQIRRLPKFNELDAAMNKVDEIFCKYNLLLTAQGLTTAHATRQYLWQEVLWEPWIPLGSQLRPACS